MNKAKLAESNRTSEEEQIVVPTFNHPERYCLIWFFVEAPQQRRLREIESLRTVLNEIFVVYNLKSVEETLQRLCDRKLFFIFDGDVDYQVLTRIHRRYQVVAIYTWQPERKSQLDEPKKFLAKVKIRSFAKRTRTKVFRSAARVHVEFPNAVQRAERRSARLREDRWVEYQRDSSGDDLSIFTRLVAAARFVEREKRLAIGQRRSFASSRAEIRRNGNDL